MLRLTMQEQLESFRAVYDVTNSGDMPAKDKGEQDAVSMMIAFQGIETLSLDSLLKPDYHTKASKKTASLYWCFLHVHFSNLVLGSGVYLLVSRADKCKIRKDLCQSKELYAVDILLIVRLCA